jgi:hypothetical protein
MALLFPLLCYSSGVSEPIEVLYDDLVAAEKLKSGTKYERLAAIAFSILTERATVHDLRLRGQTGVAHQIDAVVGDARKRVLIEAKDYDRSVDLPVVRNFWAVVEDLKPDEAFVVTTVGFSDNAIQYGTAKGLKLAVLRPPRDEDWEGLIRRVNLELVITAQAGPPNVTWELHPDDHGKIEGAGYSQGMTDTHSLLLADADGGLRPFYPLLKEQLGEDYGKVPLGGTQEIGRLNRFSEPTWLHVSGLEPLRVNAWKWSVRVASSTETIAIEEGIGGLAAELVLRTVDGSVHRMFTRDQLRSWTFDGKSVVPRGDS